MAEKGGGWRGTPGAGGVFASAKRLEELNMTREEWRAGKGSQKATTQTIQVTSRDLWGGTSTATVPVNPLTQELAKGGRLQNIRLEIGPGFSFGKEQAMRGFSVDRRQAHINEINRGLRKEAVKVKIYENSGKNRIPFVDETGTQFYAEFV